MTATSRVLRRANIGIGSRRTAIAAALICLCGFAATAASAGAETATYSTYSAIQTIPVPPASKFAGAGGGDGWSIALSETNVYNVFHHNTELDVACKVQATAKPCYEPAPGVTYGHITDESGHEFLTSGHPGMYLDNHTGRLYVYATRAFDGTAGVVCVDTAKLPEAGAFCGFTELSGKGEAPNSSWGGISGPILIGHHWYAFNYFQGKEQTGSENKLMCFDTSTDAACEGQPFAVAVSSGTYDGSDLPSPALGSSGTDVIIPGNFGTKEQLACWDDATQSTCAGSWPASIKTTNYDESYGAPFPMLDATGKAIGTCLPAPGVECVNTSGEEVASPGEIAKVITGAYIWNGPAVVLGPRVYVPNGATESVECFDYSTGKSCTGFPKVLSGLGLLYTVNPDPQRPTCLWVNSDDGPDQIQSFDAYTGEACGGGTVRVLASQFVAPAPQCTPANYVSLQVLTPSRSSYSSGSVAFANGDGELIPGLPEIALDGTGTAGLNGLGLNTATGLPQFLFTLNEPTGPVGSVEVKLTWEGNYDATCAEGKTVTTPTTPTAVTPAVVPSAVVPPTPPAAKPAGAVKAFGAARLASSANGCVASTGYTASVAGSSIASVTFTLDGHKITTLHKANSHGAFTTHIKLPVGSKEKLAMKVTFTAASKTHPVTLHRTLARCAAARPRPTPRFTG